MVARLTLAPLSTPLAICRLSADAAVPAWASGASFFSITRTFDELSIVVPEDVIPRHLAASCGWRAIRIEGAVPLDQTGILASVVGPLAQARVSVFAIATHATDYVLVPAPQREQALAALEAAGHRLNRASDP